MKPVLEILIPTFNRPESAQAAIDSVLACNDSRLTVRCNSNGYEPSLEKYRNLDPRVSYDSFKSNQGPHANSTKLFSDTNASFCMLLSDEDRINGINCENILNFLENLDKSTQVIACSIFDQSKKTYHWKPSTKISEFSIHNYVAISPLSTYMAGLIYRVNSLKIINITDLTNPSAGNAYSHLDITLHLLANGRLKFFHDRFVEKGADIKFGGDGYSHKSKELSKNISKTVNLDLNPYVYGPKARVRQFYYRENLLDKLKANIGFISFCIGKLNYIDFFYRSIIRSNKLVIISKNTIVKDEILSAYADSQQNKEYSGSVTSNLFTLLIRFPKFISYPLFLVISTMNKLIRKVYMFHYSFFKKNYKD
tara:strand:- start:354 stop:1451 length:1098 start_codon:yes stop_codon:yes gene_type:complete